MKNSNDVNGRSWSFLAHKRFAILLILFVAMASYAACVISPPSLMDDVDAVQGVIARNMVRSGDWVTARVDALVDFEKPPMIYWTMALSFKVFGVHDWAARIPIVLTVVALCGLTCSLGTWAFGKTTGLYAGLCMATCVGLFLFTRILIPDAMLTFTVGLALWGFLRALDEDESSPRLWAFVFAASLGVGVLVKGLLAAVIPLGVGFVYLLVTREFCSVKVWKRLYPAGTVAVTLLIAAPWHILAALRNPPYFVWTLHGGPGQYHGFLWFYLINEHLLRFLNLRYPRDYNTVPRLYFWLLHFVWLFPWSVYLPALARLSFRPADRAGRCRLLALCWLGFVLLFFTFSTTQEYYSMPCYPAFALLIGSAMAAGGDWVRRGTRVLCVVAICLAAATLTILFLVRHVSAMADISATLGSHPSAYTLSLGHLQDLTLNSFAYLRLPLLLAGLAFLIGAIGSFRAVGERAFLAAALMMVLFIHAARLAMVVFDPFLSSRPLAEAFVRAPEGGLITQGHFFDFSSVFFYTGRDGLLSSKQRVNLEYGSFAPGAPTVFVEDSELEQLWKQSAREYLFVGGEDLAHYQEILGPGRMSLVARSGGKFLYTNHAPGLPMQAEQTTQQTADPE